MERFRSAPSGFVREDSLQKSFDQGIVGLSGEIACLGRIVITVDKTLRILDDSDDPQVQTISYTYNARVQGVGTIMRHDNIHAHSGHPDAHHSHVYDWPNDREVEGSPRHCGEAGWPTLSEFIEKVERWYWTNRERLADPDGHPELGRMPAYLGMSEV